MCVVCWYVYGLPIYVIYWHAYRMLICVWSADMRTACWHVCGLLICVRLADMCVVCWYACHSVNQTIRRQLLINWKTHICQAFSTWHTAGCNREDVLRYIRTYTHLRTNAHTHTHTHREREREHANRQPPQVVERRASIVKVSSSSPVDTSYFPPVHTGQHKLTRWSGLSPITSYLFHDDIVLFTLGYSCLDMTRVRFDEWTSVCGSVHESAT